MNYKIIYIGERYTFDPEFVAGQLFLMTECTIAFGLCKTTAEALNHFYSYDPILLLIIEDEVEGMANFIQELRIDEVFQTLPILLMVEKNDSDQRKLYFNLGVDNLLEYHGDQDEFIMECHSSLRYKLKIDGISERLRVVTEENITRAIQLDILQKYLPQTVFSRTEDLASRQDFEIPEEEQSLAVIFADLKSFTTLSEVLPPREVISLLNLVFDLSSRTIYEYGGDLDKFIGDAFLAVFPDPACALGAAVKIQTGMQSMNEQRSIRGAPPLELRIGIHYGRLIRGSVGGHTRYDYTLIGDVVNTAQRLESMAETGGLLVSEEVFTAMDHFPMKKINFEKIDLKGKTKPVMACCFWKHLQETPKLRKDLKKYLERDASVLNPQKTSPN